VTLGEDPTIEVETSGDVDRVDVLAFYDGYDEDGDGEYLDWHGEIRRTELRGHVGTATEAPFRVTWDTRWVPDQPDGQMKLVARVRDNMGMWSVSDAVDRLSIARDGATVKLYTPSDVPEHFWVRAGRRQHCTISIPADGDLLRATAAGLFLRTWNGHASPLTVNEWEDTIGGANHYYALSRRDVPPEELRSGENVIQFHAETEHHGAEILWPGPALIMRYGK